MLQRTRFAIFAALDVLGIKYVHIKTNKDFTAYQDNLVNSMIHNGTVTTEHLVKSIEEIRDILPKHLVPIL